VDGRQGVPAEVHRPEREFKMANMISSQEYCKHCHKYTVHATEIFDPESKLVCTVCGNNWERVSKRRVQPELWLNTIAAKQEMRNYRRSMYHYLRRLEV